jgi:hypothetical protein
MHTLQSRLIDEIELFSHGAPDIEPKTRTAWCCGCEKNVTVERRDHGIGAYEYWGSRGVHHDWQDTCTECGDTNIEEVHTADEVDD